MTRNLLTIALTIIAGMAYSIAVAVATSYYFGYSLAFDWAAGAVTEGTMALDQALHLLQVHDAIAWLLIALATLPVAMLIRRLAGAKRVIMIVAALLTGTLIVWAGYGYSLWLDDTSPTIQWLQWVLAVGALPAAYSLVARK